jgi:hypothetical protein
MDYRNGVGTVWRDVWCGTRAVKYPLSPSCCLLFALVLRRLPALAAPQKHHLFLHLGKVNGRVTWTSKSTLCLQLVESRPSSSRSDQSESECPRKKFAPTWASSIVSKIRRGCLYASASRIKAEGSHEGRAPAFPTCSRAWETGLCTHCEPSTRPTPGLTMLLKVARSLRQLQHSRIRIELSRV